jgi:hypothetical protein
MLKMICSDTTFEEVNKMPIVSRKDAIILTGKSHATIYRHLRSGKLSKTPDGGIDTSELLRVYGAFVSGGDTNDTHIDTKNSVVDTYKTEKSDTEKKMLKEQIEMLKEQIEMLKSQLSDTKIQLQRTQSKEDKLFNLMENRLPPPNEQSVINLLKKKFL